MNEEFNNPNNQSAPEFALKPKRIFPSVGAMSFFMLLFTVWFFVVNIVISGVLSANSSWAELMKTDATFDNIVNIIFQLCYIGVPVAVGLWYYNGNRTELLRLNPLSGMETGIVLLLGLLMCAANTMLTAANVSIASIFTNVEIPQTPPVYTFSDKVTYVLLLVVVAPVLEEISMRGIMMRGFEGKSKWFAIILTGIFFGMLHLSYYSVLPKILMGIVMGYVVYTTNSVYSGIILHLVNNGISAIISIVADNSAVVEESADMTQLPAGDLVMYSAVYLAIAIGFCVAIVALLYILKKFTSTPDGCGGYTEKGSVRARLEREADIAWYKYIPVIISLSVLLAYMTLDIISCLK